MTAATAPPAVAPRSDEVLPDLAARPTTHRGTITYVPALDGLRALAVAAVIAFHFGISGMSGGFLGVDIFFVLSGFLITSLLTAELSGSGTVSLKSFWGRRARRLFPALFVTLVGVTVAAAFLDTPDQLASLRGDALATLFYVANWHYILASQNYFAHFGLPSPLLHTWSLAVEEQFYLLWPLVVVAAVMLATRRARRGGPVAGRPGECPPQRGASSARRLLLGVSLAGALGSAAWMAVSYHPGQDPSRLYFGTDTHAQVILVGALLALAAPGVSWAASRSRRVALKTAAAIGALFVAWEVHAMLGSAPVHPGHGFAARVAWFFDGVLGSQDFLYRGGFLLVALGVAAVIALVVSAHQGWVARALATPPIRYVGRISYGLYLYHWPTYTFLTPSSTGLTGLSLLGARLGITVVAAVLSFHLLETPIRQGLKGRLPVRRQLATLLPAGTACVVASILLATSLPAGASPKVTPATPSTAAGARPAKILLVGDSVALTLGIGLSFHQASYNVSIDDQGELGCSLAQTNPVEVSGATDTLPPCNPLTNQTWQTFWPQQLAEDRPDVVAVLFGRWEVVNRFYEGSWTHVGEPAYDAYLASQLNAAVDLLSSTGATVVLMTAPYYDEPPAPDGSPYPENDPTRVNEWNSILGQVAASIDARRPGAVAVVDLGRMLDPDGHYAPDVDGVPVRCADGVHMSYQAGEMLAPVILPSLEKLGAAAYERDGPHSDVSPVAPFTEPDVPTTPSSLRRSVSANVGLSAPYCPFGGGE